MARPIVNTGDTGAFAPAHLAQWLETTRVYLFADLDSLAAPTENALLQLPQGSHGAQTRFVARVRGRLLRLATRTPPCGQDSLQELERAFFTQVAFIARNPAIPRRMLGWLREGDVRIQRRIQGVIDRYVARLSGIIERGRREGSIAAGIDPRSAALGFVAMIQGLALATDADSRPREGLFRAAATAFARYRDGVAASAR